MEDARELVEMTSLWDACLAQLSSPSASVKLGPVPLYQVVSRVNREGWHDEVDLATQTIAEESNPPDRHDPTGTSALKRNRPASVNVSRNHCAEFSRDPSEFFGLSAYHCFAGTGLPGIIFLAPEITLGSDNCRECPGRI